MRQCKEKSIYVTRGLADEVYAQLAKIIFKNFLLTLRRQTYFLYTRPANCPDFDFAYISPTTMHGKILKKFM